MSHWIFLLGRTYPYWALPLVLGFAQFGIFFRRRKEKGQYVCAAMIVFLLVTTALWIFYRGDRHSDAWIRAFFFEDVFREIEGRYRQ